jgi:hypothetical protein
MPDVSFTDLLVVAAVPAGAAGRAWPARAVNILG